ncbi:MAG TPA: DinB family protein [Candidatus Limnocylindria bacterium]|nr:DinB family protein [Candidatus Limnocylindria bacterium]
MTDAARIRRLIHDLTVARDDLFAVLDRLDVASLTTPGLVGEWSARELIAHLGYWAGNAVETIHHVEDGRLDEIGAGALPTDETNATVARVARETDLATVRKREAASVEVLLERLRRLDPGLLDVRLPDGQTLEAGVDEDAGAHYREHADGLRAALDGGRHD